LEVPDRYHDPMNPEKLLEIGNVLASSGASREQIVETVKIASGRNAQRALNEDEYTIFAGAIARAVAIMPSFRDAIALIRPYRDYTTPTLYTDAHSRVGIGTFFFLDSVNPHRRASLLLHEAMHILNNHFTRKVDFAIDPASDNSAKDLEINSLLNRSAKTDLSMLLLPEQDPFNFPQMQSYEQYAKLMKNKGLIPEEPGMGGPPEKQPEGEGQPPEQDTSSEGQGSEAEKGEPGEKPEDSPKADEQEKSESEGSDGDSAEGSEDGDAEQESEDSSDGGSDGDDSDAESSEGDSSEGDDSESGEGGSSEEDSESDGESGSSSSSSSSSSSDPEDIADEAMEGDSEGSSGGAPSSSCDHSTSEREKKADDLNIERASSAEQAVARNNTIARVREEAARSKAAGDRAALLMLQKMELAMEPSKVDWRVFFRNLMSNCRDSISLGRTDHTYRRVNKRMSTGEFIFPGMIRYEPSCIMAVDTSGSMSLKDFAYLLSELETIVKSVLRAKDRFKAFCVDAKATEPETVRAIKDLNLKGGGGTKMEMAVRSIELLPKKEIPDIFILATDGGTNWNAFRAELLKSKHRYRTVVLITQEDTYEVAKNTLKGLADVLDISEKGNGQLGY